MSFKNLCDIEREIMEQILKEFLTHEDVWIFIILIIIVLNTFIIAGIINRLGRKTDAMYEFIKNLISKNNSLNK